MSFNYSANQFEQQFLPKSLCNWEVPKYNPRAYPRQKTKTTRIIANDRGHLLPGIGKAGKANGGCLSEAGKREAWTNYRGTWNLPGKILTKQEAFELNGLALQTPFSGPRWKRSSQKQLNRKRSQNNLKEKQLKLLSHATNNHEQDLSYVPGEIVEPGIKHPSPLTLERLKLNEEQVDEENRNSNLYLEEHNCEDAALNLKELESSNLIHDTIKSGQDGQEDMMKYNIPDKPTEKEDYMPYIPAYCNFETARRMAQDNLGHQPLPDAVVDNAFRKMQASGSQFPGLALEDIMPVATGFGLRNTKAGPTQCTKMMKIYRPKTCGIVPKPVDKFSQDRPHSSICEKKMGPMDLAICWDYRPFDPRDEPKPPVHIDGSNDSAGPAVFTLVKTPRDVENPQATGRSTGALFANTLGEENFFFDKDLLKRNQEYKEKYSLERKKCECGNQDQRTSERHSANNHQQQDRLRSSSSHRPKTTSRDASLRGHSQNLQRSFHKSSPNLSEMVNASSSDENGGPDACHLVCIKHDAVDFTGNHLNHLQRFKSQPELNYNSNKKQQRISRPCNNKMAPTHASAQKQHCKPTDLRPFKAGIPNRNSNNSFDSGCSSMSDSQPKQPAIRVPKPRNPYAHKNYNIDTLAPPFACWKGGSGQGGYPIFRLASVYQHSYKPIDQRRRPLLATVYK